MIQAMALEGWKELRGHLPNRKGAHFLARLPWWLDQSAHIHCSRVSWACVHLLFNGLSSPLSYNRSFSSTGAASWAILRLAVSRLLGLRLTLLGHRLSLAGSGVRNSTLGDPYP